MQPLSHRSEDRRGHGFGSESRVDDDASCRLGGGDLEESITQPLVKRGSHALVAVISPLPLCPPGSGPGQADIHRYVEDDREIGG